MEISFIISYFFRERRCAIMNRGLVFAMLSSLMFSFMNVLVKKASHTLGTGEIIFVRSVISIFMILLIMRIGKIKFSHKDRGTLIFRGVVGGMSMCLIFLAVSGMHLGDASILQQLSAFFVLIISAIYLKEKLPSHTIMPLIIIVLGTCLILRPWEYNSFSVYALFAIASAFTGAVVYTTIHKLFENGGHTSWEVIFYLFLCSVFIGLAMMYNNHHMPTRYEWFLLLGIALTSLFGQNFMTQAYEFANQVLVSFVMYLGVFFNALWGYVFFGEIMHTLSIIGGVLVIGSSIYLSHKKAHK